MASEWYNTRIIKPMRIFQTRPNTEFSIYEKTGLRVGLHIKSPTILFSYREMVSNEYIFNAKLNLIKISDDKYKIIPLDSNISNSSIIDVLVMESDEDIGVISNKATSYLTNDWINIDKINSKSTTYKIFELNKTNNYLLDISSMNIVKGSEKMIFFIQNLKYFAGCYHIKIDPQKITNTTYSVKLSQKYCDKSINVGSLAGTSINLEKVGHWGDSSFSVQDTGNVSMFIHCKSHPDMLNYNKHFKILIDGTEVASSQALSSLPFGRIAYTVLCVRPFQVYGKNKTKTITISPIAEIKGYTQYIYEYVYNTSTSTFYDTDNYSLLAFVYGEAV